MLDLGAWAFSCVTEQLCPESRAAGDPSLPSRGDDQGTGRTIARNPDSCDICWAPTARTIIRFLVRTQAGQPPDTEQLFGLAAKPGWAGTRKRTMAGFCGFGGSPKPDEPGTEPYPESLGKPEPDSPRHPRK